MDEVVVEIRPHVGKGRAFTDNVGEAADRVAAELTA